MLFDRELRCEIYETIRTSTIYGLSGDCKSYESFFKTVIYDAATDAKPLFETTEKVIDWELLTGRDYLIFRDVPGTIIYRVLGIKTFFLLGPGTEYRIFNKLEKVEEK